LAVAFLFQLLDWNEAKGSGIHAVTQPGWSWSIIKDMPKVRVTLGTDYLISDHSMGRVPFSNNRIGVDRFGKAGPTCAGIEFVL
jgi:hypothetical protein